MNALALMLLTAAGPGADPVPAVTEGAAPAIRLWLNNNRQFREGERARVQVESRDDGYLLVLNYDTEGRLRVLFPIDPSDDNLVRGGRRYEIEGRADRESFIVGRDGDGMVYAAVSPDPFDFRDYQTGRNWDYTRFAIDRDSRDPEADITDLLERLTSERGFDYDILEYRVWGYRGYRPVTAWYPRPYGFYDDFYCDYWHRPSLFGCRYWWPGYYGHRYGFGFTYYDPYRWGYWNPWYRGRYVYGGYPRSGRWPVVAGRPRGYTIVRRPAGSTRTDGFPGSFGGGSFGGRRQPAVVDSRPRGYDRPRPERGERPTGTARPANPDRGRDAPDAVARPRGRRASPGDGGDNRPNIERDRGSSRGSGSDRARPAEGSDRARPSEGSGRSRPSDGSSRPRGRPAAEASDIRSAVVPERRSVIADESPRVAVPGRARPGHRSPVGNP